MSEVASVLIGVPLVVWVATLDRKLVTAEKVALGAFAVSALAVDGWLISRFAGIESDEATSPQLIFERLAAGAL